MKTPTPPPPPRWWLDGYAKHEAANSAEVRQALAHLRFGMEFAYQQGLHEFGYDPIETLVKALGVTPHSAKAKT